MTTGARAKHAVEYGVMPLVGLALLNALQAGESNGIGYATDGIKSTFHVSNFTVSLLPVAATVLGIPAVLIIGPLADRVSRTKLIGLLMVLWTVSLGLAGTATSIALLFLFRSVVGALESNGPAAISLLADYYPVEQRSRKMSLWNLGGAGGGALALGIGPLVDLGGWRMTFLSWVPIGIIASVLLFRLPNPHRGQQDVSMGSLIGADASTETEAEKHRAVIIEHLPAPDRVGTCTYDGMSTKEMYTELRQIKSMWFGVISITISQLLLNAAGYWSPQYFKDFHHLSNTGAAGIITLLGLGSFAGIIVGGMVADRRLAKGNINSRIELIIIGTVGASVTTAPAYLIHNLWLATPLFVIGGFFFTLPIGPAEAMLADVVPSELRGRAAGIRSVMRSASVLGIPAVGAISLAIGLAPALAVFTPIYAIGGFVAMRARATYGHDLAYVLAEANRTGGGHNP